MVGQQAHGFSRGSMSEKMSRDILYLDLAWSGKHGFRIPEIRKKLLECVEKAKMPKGYIMWCPLSRENYMRYEITYDVNMNGRFNEQVAYSIANRFISIVHEEIPEIVVLGIWRA